MQQDPRYYQIVILSFLLIYGLLFLDFEIHIAVALIILTTAQLTQYCFTRGLQLPKFDPSSALISSLSLCLLLRTDTLWLAALAAFIAIASKFLIRWQNKHVFNPANFALVIVIMLSDSAWVSAGQWGRDLLFVFLVACLGMLVIHRSQRADITLAFLGFYTVMIYSRAIWLGDPLSIPAHQLQSGALLIFAFFMISDPMTTPNARSGRILFAALVTLGTGYVQFILYQPNGVLYGLVIGYLLTPLINSLLLGDQFKWNAPISGHASVPLSLKHGESDEKNRINY